MRNKGKIVVNICYPLNDTLKNRLDDACLKRDPSPVAT